MGNTIGAGDKIGSLNNFPLIFTVNNSQKMMLKTNGDLQLTNLIGSGNRFLQADATGNIFPFIMGTPSQVLYGNGTWGSLPAIPAPLWNTSGSNIYYTAGNVGIGTSTPLYPLDVIGDVRVSNNLYVGGGIIITEKVNANAEVVTGKMRADSIVTDSTKGFYGTSRFNGDVKLENKLSVNGNAVINGSVDVNSDFKTFGSVTFAGDKKISFTPATASFPAVFGWGGPTFSGGGGPSPPCYPIGVPFLNTFSGLIQSYGDNSLKIMTMGWDGTNGIIDVSQGATGNSKLLLNYNCGKDVQICTGINGGNVNITDGIGRVGIGTLTAPSQKLEVAHDDATGGIALNRLSTATTSKSEIKFNKNGTQLYAIGNDLDGTGAQTFFIWDNVTNTAPLLINAQGKVGLGGVIPPLNGSIYKLYVDGGIATRDVKVTVLSFPDYVFEDDYKLITIDELGKYILKNHHLPHIQSAKEITKNEGFEIGAMQVNIVKTVEEQALYIVDLQKQLDELKKEIRNIKNK